MKINLTKKIKFFIILVFLLNFNLVYAEKINLIEIKGNDRVSNETILIFSELNIGDEVDENGLNSALRLLYQTNYFKNIKMSFNEGTLKIVIEENPIIQSISIKGIKNKNIVETLSDITKKEEKSPYEKYIINNQKNLLINVLRSSGFYYAEVDVKIKENNNNNTVDIIYNFYTGERAKINSIKFIGNKSFKSIKLKNLIVSEESKPWKFISTKKYLDINRIKLDENLLINFYKNKGFYNVSVNSSHAKLIDKQNFELIFNINEGNKFFFNTVNLKISENYSTENFEDFIKFFEDLKGKKYSLNSIKKIISKIDKIALQKEFEFVNAKYTEKIIDNNKIDIDIFFEESEKFYIERINIFGNYITEEKVIRNSLITDEGDPFNKILFNKSVNNIKARNIFKSVETEISDSKINKNNKIINLIIEEKATGEIFAGAGTGTDGSSIAAGVKEGNYLGKGIQLDANLALSDDEIKGRFSVNNPNYKNTDKSMRTTIESTTSDFLTSSGYKTTRTGLSLGTKFEQYSDLFVTFELSNYYEKLETSSLASAIKKRQEGDYFENLITYVITYNKLDQNFQPSEGFLSKFSQTLPIYSDDLAIENKLDIARYYSLTDNVIFSAKFFAKAVNSLDDDVRVSKRVYIPGRKLRGFESGKIGPIDGNQYIGGNYGTAINLNSSLPNIINGYENLDFNIFIDAANLWSVDYDSSLDSNKIRSSTGISLDWFTPVGPLSFSYAIPLTEAKSDKTESFRFQLGTTF